jgi:hypothetical protein
VTAVSNNLSTPVVTPVAIPNVTKPAPRREEQPPVPPIDAADEARPAPLRGIAVYVDGPGRHGANDRALDRLREELRGVHEVVLLAGGQQVEVYRALHRYIPNLTFGSDSPVVIRFDSTAERLGRDRQHLTASATIVKNGREIFRYDLPSVVDPGAAADAFAQTIAEAFSE